MSVSLFCLPVYMSSCLSPCRQFSVFSDRRTHSRPNKLDRCRKDFIKKNLVSVFSLVSLSTCLLSLHVTIYMPIYYILFCLTILLSV